MTLAEQPYFLHGQMAITADTRNYPDHPTHGGLYRVSAGAFVASQKQFSFARYEVEGLQTFPMLDRAWVIVVRGWGVFTQTSENREVPFYLLPALGSANTLPGYENYRYHDRNLVLAGVESRWAIWAHMDGVVFVDSGTVAPVIRDLGLDNTAYGFGFRIHTHKATVGRLDFAHNREGWSWLWRSGDPYNLSRLKRWVAAIPFVP
jgi:outer membrane protein assembly factor BamA